MAAQNMYETEEVLAQYLLFHYGEGADQLPHAFGPEESLHYPTRCISECMDPEKLPERARALDLGCAVGRSSFELARYCRNVVGIDFSAAFIAAAEEMKELGTVRFDVHEEGVTHRALEVHLPGEIDRSRVRFERGDACHLDSNLGTFDVILMANLIDRLEDPSACLKQLSALANPGAQLIITSPYTWLPSCTPEEKWLGNEKENTLTGLQRHLEGAFSLLQTKDLPFLIREHYRKYQWSVAEASIWIKR